MNEVLHVRVWHLQRLLGFRLSQASRHRPHEDRQVAASSRGKTKVGSALEDAFQHGLRQLPRGAKNPIFEVSGSKNHTLNGIWDQKPQIVGTWALWVLFKVHGTGNKRGCRYHNPGSPGRVQKVELGV